MSGVASWVLTYLLHSTVLIVVVAIAAPRLRRWPQLVAPMWAVALIGGIVTASLPSPSTTAAGPQHSSVAKVEAPVVPQTLAMEPVLAATDPQIGVADGGPTPAKHDPTADADSATPLAVAAVRQAAPQLSRASADRPLQTRLPVWLILLLSVLPLLGIVVAGVSIGRAVVRLRHQLRHRRSVGQGPLRALLMTLLRRARTRQRVALSTSADVEVPLATGVVRPEIVVPERAATRLGPAQQEGLLAHELAHVVYRDPAWRIVALAVERVFFFQPLNRLAVRGLAAASELRADDWAAHHTRQPLALARCLTEVAAWQHVEHDAALASAALGQPRSALGRRVHRLLDRNIARSRRRSRLMLLPALGGLLLLATLVPSVAAATRPSKEERKEARQEKKAVNQARRAAKKDMRREFKEAKKRGEAAPTAETAASIVRDARGEEEPEPTPSVVVDIGGEDGIIVIVDDAGAVDVTRPRGRKHGRHDRKRHDAKRTRAEAEQARARARAAKMEALIIKQGSKETHAKAKKKAKMQMLKQLQKAKALEKQHAKHLEKSKKAHQKASKAAAKALRKSAEMRAVLEAQRRREQQEKLKRKPHKMRPPRPPRPPRAPARPDGVPADIYEI